MDYNYEGLGAIPVAVGSGDEEDTVDEDVEERRRRGGGGGGGPSSSSASSAAVLDPSAPSSSSSAAPFSPSRRGRGRSHIPLPNCPSREMIQASAESAESEIRTRLRALPFTRGAELEELAEELERRGGERIYALLEPYIRLLACFFSSRITTAVMLHLYTYTHLGKTLIFSVHIERTNTQMNNLMNTRMNECNFV